MNVYLGASEEDEEIEVAEVADVSKTDSRAEGAGVVLVRWEVAIYAIRAGNLRLCRSNC